MAITISKIENLSNNITPITGAELTKFDNNGAFAAKITATNVTATTWDNFATPNDNIQVTWSDGTTVVTRAVGGTFTKTGTTVTISGLANASKYSVGVNGQLLIGPEGQDNAAAIVNVRMGNLITTINPKGDWIIDFSDKTDEAGGSSINLKVLIDWIKRNTGDTAAVPELPPVKGEDGVAKKPEDFIIEFRDFYYNITQKTFDFWVTSKDGQTVKFGNFTIRKVGFRVTNIAVNPSLEAPKS